MGLFVLFAAISLVAVIITTPNTGGFWNVLVVVGQKVEPLWIVSAILAYTLREGANMLAEKYLERRFNEGKAEGKAEVLLDIRRAAERGNLTQEDVERILSVLSVESGVVITKSPNGG